jgi:hypothetical protein
MVHSLFLASRCGGGGFFTNPVDFLEVLLQLPRETELLLANVAFVGRCAGVGQQVHLDFTLPDELFRAEWALDVPGNNRLKLIQDFWPLSPINSLKSRIMDHHMLPKVRTCRESFAAHLTNERFHRVMAARVFFQLRLKFKNGKIQFSL